jgi:hypothetical protein
LKFVPIGKEDTMRNHPLEHVFPLLHKDRVTSTTKEALVQAFQDDGIYDLEGVVEHILGRFRYDIEMQRTEPRRAMYVDYSRPTPPEIARDIRHPAPEVPFLFEGDTYDPADIRRFDGQPLVYVIGGAEGEPGLHVFREEYKPVITGYLQAQAYVRTMGFGDGSPPPPVGGFPGDYTPGGPIGCGGVTGIPCGKTQVIDHPPPPPTSPLTSNEIQMFDDDNWRGNWFWLARGFIWKDLTKVHRGGLFGGVWNDAITSLARTNGTCFYHEHVQLQGDLLIVKPFQDVANLTQSGWNDRISSVHYLG